MLSNPSYNTHGPHTVPHGRNQHYPGVNPHDAEVLRKRAISPEIAAERCYRTQGDRLVIPWLGTQGEAGPEQTRPHNPRPNKDGKIAKYLFRTGTQMILDVHPRSLPHLRDRYIPIIITESALKEDAIISDFIASGVRKFCAVGINGVNGWRSGDMPLDDWDDVPLKLTRRGQIIHQREVYIAFDSDAATKAGPMRERWRLTAFLRRRKAKVWWIDVPTVAGDSNPDTNKQGIDDALASGHTMKAMLASAYPAPDIMPKMETDESDNSEIAQLRRRAEYQETKAKNAERRAMKAEALARVQAEIILNPSYVKVDRPILYSAVTKAIEAIDKQGGDSHQAVLPLEGISNDWRRAGQSGPYNDNGTMIITDRKSGKSILERFIGEGVLSAELKPARRHVPGRSWDGWDVVIDIDDPIQALDRIAQWVSPTERKKRAANKPVMEPLPCTSCGEVHSRTQVTMCNGCGAEDAPPKVLPPKRVEVSAGGSRSEKFSDNRTTKTMGENFSDLLPPDPERPSSPVSPPPAPRDRAQAWLFNVLMGGMRPVADVERAAKNAGIAPELVRSARDALNVTSCQLRGESRVYWTLPREHAV